MSLSRTVMRSLRLFQILWILAGMPALLSAGVMVTLETNLGVMRFELWPEVAPKTVANFVKLAGEGFYDGTAFHRVIKGRVVYGGDPLSKDSGQAPNWGTGGPGYSIEAELNERKHEFGVLSMDHNGNPNSAGSRFLICLAPSPNLNRRYTAFGKLVSGAEVLKRSGRFPSRRSPRGSGAARLGGWRLNRSGRLSPDLDLGLNSDLRLNDSARWNGDGSRACYLRSHFVRSAA